MGFLKRLAFYLGLALGLVVVAVAGAVSLTYLFTGKFPVVNVRDEGTEVTLMPPDEIAVLLRGKTHRARGTPPSIALE